MPQPLPLLDREKNLPAIKLTVVQYAILGVMLLLLFGLWRLQITDAENYRALAQANRIPK